MVIIKRLPFPLQILSSWDIFMTFSSKEGEEKRIKGRYTTKRWFSKKRIQYWINLIISCVTLSQHHRRNDTHCSVVSHFQLHFSNSRRQWEKSRFHLEHETQERKHLKSSRIIFSILHPEEDKSISELIFYSRYSSSTKKSRRRKKKFETPRGEEREEQEEEKGRTDHLSSTTLLTLSPSFAPHHHHHHHPHGF